MALSSSISQKELRRLAIRAYEGKTLWVRLCSLVTEAYDENTSVTSWSTIELPAGVSGYSPFSAVIQPGVYDTPSGRYKMPSIDAPFSAIGGVLTYNTVLLYIEDYTTEEETTTGVNISLQSSTNTITQTSGNFTILFAAGEYIQVSGSSGGQNDGIYEIDSVSALAISLSANTPIPTDEATGASITLTRALQFPYAILDENPNITLSPGQTQTYRIDLNTDDG